MVAELNPIILSVARLQIDTAYRGRVLPKWTRVTKVDSCDRSVGYSTPLPAWRAMETEQAVSCFVTPVSGNLMFCLIHSKLCIHDNHPIERQPHGIFTVNIVLHRAEKWTRKHNSTLI